MTHKRNTSGLIPYKKGQSGNTMGRPKGFKGLAKMIRAKSDDGKVFVEFAWSVFDGSLPEQTTFAQRWEAFMWLSNRQFGKAPQVMEVHVEDGASKAQFDLSSATDEELEELERAAKMAQAIVERGKGPIDV